MFGIAILGEPDQARDVAMQKHGKLTLVDSWQALLDCDASVLLVDLRQSCLDSSAISHASADVESVFGTEFSVGARADLDKPLIGIVSPEQSLHSLAFADQFDELVSSDDLKSSAFAWRMERLIQRYQAAISLVQLNQPENRVLQKIVNHLNDWVIIKDLEHRFVLVSDPFAKEVGLSREEIIGKDDLQIGSNPASVLGDPETGYPGFWAQDEAVMASGKPSFEDNLDWQAFSDDRRYKRTERVPLFNANGEIYALLVRTTDITGVVQAEKNLEARNVVLQQVTEEKQRAEHHRLMAEQAIETKNTFLAAASHDLRQPLHALGLFLGVLDRRLDDPQDREILEKIQHSSDALIALFNSLLDISRLDAGVVDVQIQAFSLEQMLDNFRDEFSALGAKKSLQVSICNSQQIVSTDPVLFARILRNLLQNAITHTIEGAITVMCSITHSSLQIHIADTGPGIPKAEQQAIFTEFYQLERPGGGTTHGLGLGLAIVNRLADLLNLRVSLDSNLGKGTTFTVEVPLGLSSIQDQPDVELEPDDLSELSVLLIDDDTVILDGLARMLQTYHCATLTAESASETLEKLESSHFVPDVMVVDYQLRHNQFGDAAIDLVCNYFGRSIPAIIVTGDTSAQRLRDANRSGNLLLHKPVNATELVRSILDVRESVLEDEL